MVVIILSHKGRSATNRDVAEASLYFPKEQDLGTDIEDIAVVLVYNNDHHYSGTIPLKKDFKDGIDTLTSLLKDCRIIGDNL